MLHRTKKSTLFLLLWLGYVPLVSAIELLETLSETQVPKDLPMTQEAVEKKKFNLLAMLIGCDLNDQCVLSMLKAVIKTDPNPMYNAFLLKLEAQTNQIEYEAAHCNIPDNDQVKKAVANCLSSELKKNISSTTGATEISVDSIEVGVNTCIQKNMEKLANEGNLFAQASLVRYLMKMNQAEEGKRWAETIQKQAGTPPYEAYQRCMQPVN